jgi:hypothetical protein
MKQNRPPNSTYRDQHTHVTTAKPKKPQTNEKRKVTPTRSLERSSELKVHFIANTNHVAEYSDRIESVWNDFRTTQNISC